MSTEFKCKHCESSDLFMRKNGPHVGLYCNECKKWIRWMKKKDIESFMNSTGQVYTHAPIENVAPIPVSVFDVKPSTSNEDAESPPWEV